MVGGGGFGLSRGEAPRHINQASPSSLSSSSSLLSLVVSSATLYVRVVVVQKEDLLLISDRDLAACYTYGGGGRESTFRDTEQTIGDDDVKRGEKSPLLSLFLQRCTERERGKETDVIAIADVNN